MPVLGLGSWMSKPVEGRDSETYEMVANALKCGYRHIDTAFGYGNEQAVGMAIRDSDIPRKDIFVTTKLTNSDHGRVAEAFERSFKALDIEYIDLYVSSGTRTSGDTPWLTLYSHSSCTGRWPPIPTRRRRFLSANHLPL